MKICHVVKFLHMTDFSPRVRPVVPVTNIRYGYDQQISHFMPHYKSLQVDLSETARVSDSFFGITARQESSKKYQEIQKKYQET